MKKQIAIIGNGKLAKALAAGCLSAGYKKEELIVIGARPTSDLSYFRELGIPVSCEICRMEGVPFVFHIVTPLGVGAQLRRLEGIHVPEPYRIKSGKIEQFVRQQSFFEVSSGAKKHQFSRILGEGKLVKATMNTNVRKGKGIISVDRTSVTLEEVRFLEKFGTVIRCSVKDIKKMVTTVGAGNAIDAKALLLIFLAYRSEAKGRKLSLRSWLEKVNALLEGSECARGLKIELLSGYLHAKRNVFRDDLGFSEQKSLLHAAMTLKSTVQTLLLEKPLTTMAIERHIMQVATKGGCTERGLSKMNMNTIDDLEAGSLEEIFLDIHCATKQMDKKAADSIVEAFMA